MFVLSPGSFFMSFAAGQLQMDLLCLGLWRASPWEGTILAWGWAEHCSGCGEQFFWASPVLMGVYFSLFLVSIFIIITIIMAAILFCFNAYVRISAHGFYLFFPPEPPPHPTREGWGWGSGCMALRSSWPKTTALLFPTDSPLPCALHPMIAKGNLHWYFKWSHSLVSDLCANLCDPKADTFSHLRWILLGRWLDWNSC